MATCVPFIRYDRLHPDAAVNFAYDIAVAARVSPRQRLAALHRVRPLSSSTVFLRLLSTSAPSLLAAVFLFNFPPILQAVVCCQCEAERTSRSTCR